MAFKEIEQLVAQRVNQVSKQRVAGEFVAASNLEERLDWSTSSAVWIGKIVQVDMKSATVEERDIVAVPAQLGRINAHMANRLGSQLVHLGGKQVEMEVEPVLAPGGELKLKVWRVFSVQEPGCWTLAKASEREALGGNCRSRATTEKELRFAEIPRKITVIAPPQGSASRSNMKEILSSSRMPGEVQVEWNNRVKFTGPDAPKQIAAAVRNADSSGNVVLLARGGGRKSDFWPFETSEVGRAIRECRGHVFTALGHEEDKTLADELADRSFAVPRSAAVAIARACGGVRGPGGREWTRRKQKGSLNPRIDELERGQRRLSTSNVALIAERDELREELKWVERERSVALADRDRAQSDLGEAVLRALEPGAGSSGLVRMRDAVHFRYFSVVPLALATLFGYACAMGADGASRVVWGVCTALYVGAVAVCWIGSWRLERQARSLLSSDQ